MKEYITIDGRIEFAADYIDIRCQDSGLICSLSGQFVKDREPFDPPMEYSMANMRVTAQDPKWILTPIYYDLESQRETKSENSDKVEK